MDDGAEVNQESRTIREFVDYPDHKKRSESAEFRANKRRLVVQLDVPCWICGGRQSREVHHIHEWSLWNALDPVKVLNSLHVFDPYGYTHAAGDKPIESPDDIRNLLVLCEVHHRGINTGVHYLTMPIWFPQRAVKDGMAITKAIEHVKEIDNTLKRH
ncbi:MAG: hypothetical protein K2Y28_08505 [Burkholderiaceae bacterium]|nr:hypothetical protein [Burkholderiaceae bacterium]